MDLVFGSTPPGVLCVLKLSAVPLQMFLTVFTEQNVSEVPITPETLCRDVVEWSKEPGEGAWYLAETWRSSGEDLAGHRLLEVESSDGACS